MATTALNTNRKFQFTLGSIRARLLLLIDSAGALLQLLWGSMAYSVRVIQSNNFEWPTKLTESALISAYRESLSKLNEPGNNVIENWDAAKEKNLLEGCDKSHAEVGRRLAQTLSRYPTMGKLQAETQTHSVEMTRIARQAIDAAQEIVDLTSSSVKVTDNSGELLRALVPSIRKTAELVQEVAAASRAQAKGVAQVNQAMTQMDRVTQSNASAAEEISSTAKEMAAQAKDLQGLLSVFQVSGNRGIRVAPSRSATMASQRRTSGHGKTDQRMQSRDRRRSHAATPTTMTGEL